MHRRMTITLDEVVYEGLYRTVGKRRMSQFIEDLLRPHVVDTSLDDGYRAMATDKAREAEAIGWFNVLCGDIAGATPWSFVGLVLPGRPQRNKQNPSGSYC